MKPFKSTTVGINYDTFWKISFEDMRLRSQKAFFIPLTENDWKGNDLYDDFQNFYNPKKVRVPLENICEILGYKKNKNAFTNIKKIRQHAHRQGFSESPRPSN